MIGIGEKIAKKYAKALFESFEQGELEKVAAVLENLAGIWEANQGVRYILMSPTVLASERRDALLEIGKMTAESFGVSPVDHISRFLALVEGNGRIHGLPEIAESFLQLLRESKQELQITVISAGELHDDEKQEIAGKVKNAGAALSQIEWQVEPSILGGVIIRTGDREIDGSIRGALVEAKASLMEA